MARASPVRMSTIRDSTKRRLRTPEFVLRSHRAKPDRAQVNPAPAPFARQNGQEHAAGPRRDATAAPLFRRKRSMRDCAHTRWRARDELPTADLAHAPSRGEVRDSLQKRSERSFPCFGLEERMLDAVPPKTNHRVMRPKDSSHGHRGCYRVLYRPRFDKRSSSPAWLCMRITASAALKSARRSASSSSRCSSTIVASRPGR